MTRVAVIGVGRMGGPMARRLLAAGHELTVCDPSPAAVQGLCALGAGQSEDPAGAAAAAEITITCLPSPEIIESVVMGERGALAGAPLDGIIIDMSTSLPSLARRLAEAGDRRGVPVLDAPVTGGPRGAEAGTLAIMVGGRRAHLSAPCRCSKRWERSSATWARPAADRRRS